MPYKDPEKKKKNQKEYFQRYYQKNKEKIKEKYWKNRDENIKRMRIYQNSHPHRMWASKTLGRHKNQFDCIVNISVIDLEQIAKKIVFCPICDCKLKWWPGKLCNESPTLDRKNNEKELNMDNTWIICHRCNTTKLDRTFKEFIKYCKMVGKKFKGESEC